MSHVEAVSFANADGLRLFGTLHRGHTVDAKLPAIVLLSPGVKMRVGPGRLYVPLTEMLTAQGYLVLRFDFYGLGDSEGELDETMLADVYNAIQAGRYVDDTVCAMRWLSREHGVQRFVLGGLCGGALTALFAAQREASVEALMSIGLPVTVSSNAGARPQHMARAELDNKRRGYFKKALKLEPWLRFITLRSDYALIWHSMKRLVIKDRVQASNEQTALDEGGNENLLFPPAFFAFLERGGRALMLFSEKDRLLAEYEEKFAERFAGRMPLFAGQIDKHVVPNANHVLSLPEWQREMVAVCERWLSRLRTIGGESAGSPATN